MPARSAAAACSALTPQVRNAIQALIIKGKIKQIVNKWGMTNAVTLIH